MREQGGESGGPGDVVADEAEPRDARVCLHDAAKGRLGILSHAVGLIENDDLERWCGVGTAQRKI